MTSVDTSSSYAIDLNRDGRHQVSLLDDEELKEKNQNLQVAMAVVQRAADSGAVIANATRDGGGANGATTAAGSTASMVNSSLASRGMSLSPSGLSSIDDFTAESANAGAALDFTGAPQLPENGGTSSLTSTAAAISQSTGTMVANGHATLSRAASAITDVSDRSDQVPLQGSDLQARLSDYQSRNADGDAGLMWYALSTMAKGANQDERDAANIKNALQKGKLEEKKNEITATQQQIADERAAAGMTLMFSTVSAVAQMALSGSNMALGYALGPLINSTGSYINKMAGPEYQANQKKIEVMRHQMTQEVYEQGIENAKSNYDEARELMKLAIKILSEHAERQTQISTTITRT